MSLLLEALKKAAQDKQEQQTHSSPAQGQTSGGSEEPVGADLSTDLALEPVTDYRVPDDEPELDVAGNDLPRDRGPAPDPGMDSSGKPNERPQSVRPPEAAMASSLPHMQGAQAAAGLTPDAAKQVFESKRISSPRHTRLMILGVMGVVVLMAVVLSLFYYSSQVSNLDQQIATFKREPRALSPPPPRAQDPASGQPASANGQDDGLSDMGGTTDVDRRASGAPIIDQIEEGIVSANGTGDLGETAARIEKPARRKSNESPSSDKIASSRLRVERRGTGGSLSVTSGAPPAGEQRNGVVLRSSSRIPEPDRLLLQAYQAYQAGDLGSAEQAYGQVLRLRPDDRDALLGLGAILQRQGSKEGALSIYRRLLELDPKDSVARSAVLELSMAQGVARESDLKNMLRDQPDAAHLHFALGNVYAGSGRWPQAQGAYFDAFRLAPSNADYAFNLAVSLDQLGKQQAARRYYEQAVNAARAGAAVSFSVQGAERRLEVISQAAPEG